MIDISLTISALLYGIQLPLSAHRHLASGMNLKEQLVYIRHRNLGSGTE
jgi:hypothetical protein